MSDEEMTLEQRHELLSGHLEQRQRIAELENRVVALVALAEGRERNLEVYRTEADASQAISKDLAKKNEKLYIQWENVTRELAAQRRRLKPLEESQKRLRKQVGQLTESLELLSEMHQDAEHRANYWKQVANDYKDLADRLIDIRK